METIAISKFKATCLSLFEQIKKTGEPLLITKKGHPIALVTPPPPQSTQQATFGLMKGTIEIKGDIVSPLSTDDWEVYKS